MVALGAQVREGPLARRVRSERWRPEPAHSGIPQLSVPAVANVLSLNKPRGPSAQALLHPEPRFL